MTFGVLNSYRPIAIVLKNKVELLQDYSQSFLLAYLAGAVFLLFFCYDRFDQPANEGSFVETLVPRHLASNAEYLRAFLIYFGVMLTIYTLVTFAGPAALDVGSSTEGFTDTEYIENAAESDPFDQPRSKQDDPVWFPLAVVLMLAGASTRIRIPLLNSIELFVRRMTHRIIGIPDGIQKRAQQINTARIDIKALNENDASFIKSKYKEATGEELSNIEDYYEKAENQSGILINWIRLNYLFRVIDSRWRDLPGFDSSIQHSYPSMWNKLRSSMLDLSAKRISEALVESQQDLDSTDRSRIRLLQEDVDQALHDIHAYIAACIAHGVTRKEEMGEMMRSLKLVVTSDERIDFSEAFLVALVMVFFYMFIVVIATPGIIDFFGHAGAVSKHMPSDYTQAISWSTSTVFLHGAAAFAALRYRIKRGSEWRSMRIREAEIPALQYLTVTVIAYIAATLGLLVWWILSESMFGQGLILPSLKEFWIPMFGSLGMVTGFWVNYSLDVVERSETTENIRLLQQAAGQGLSTGLVCYVLLVMMPDPDVKPDFEIYTATVAAFAGLAIGLIISLYANQKQLKRDKKRAKSSANHGADQ